MATPQKYIHDRIVLLLLSLNAFSALFLLVWVLIKLQGGRTGGYIVQYRSNLGISAFKTGGIGGIVSFIVFAVLIACMTVALSSKAYPIRRQLALALLSLGLLLQVIGIIISNALLSLH